VAVSWALIVSTLSQIFEALDGAEVAAEAGDEQLERFEPREGFRHAVD
jgi:hypothetical protein